MNELSSYDFMIMKFRDAVITPEEELNLKIQLDLERAANEFSYHNPNYVLIVFYEKDTDTWQGDLKYMGRIYAKGGAEPIAYIGRRSSAQGVLESANTIVKQIKADT